VFREARAIASSSTPLLGIHILMKTDVAQKLANVTNAVEQGLITPIELICRAKWLARSRAVEACQKPCRGLIAMSGIGKANELR